MPTSTCCFSASESAHGSRHNSSVYKVFELTQLELGDGLTSGNMSVSLNHHLNSGAWYQFTCMQLTRTTIILSYTKRWTSWFVCSSWQNGKTAHMQATQSADFQAAPCFFLNLADVRVGNTPVPGWLLLVGCDDFIRGDGWSDLTPGSRFDGEMTASFRFELASTFLAKTVAALFFGRGESVSPASFCLVYDLASSGAATGGSFLVRCGFDRSMSLLISVGSAS